MENNIKIITANKEIITLDDLTKKPKRAYNKIKGDRYYDKKNKEYYQANAETIKPIALAYYHNHHNKLVKRISDLCTTVLHEDAIRAEHILRSFAKRYPATFEKYMNEVINKNENENENDTKPENEIEKELSE